MSELTDKALQAFCTAGGFYLLVKGIHILYTVMDAIVAEYQKRKEKKKDETKDTSDSSDCSDSK